MAPLARIVLVEATDSSFNALISAVTLANNLGAGILSMSFGSAEWADTTPFNVQLFATAGMTYFASTGDSGMAVSWPAVSAGVVATGGTTLTFSGTGTRSEVAWSGTGGGISAYTPLPTYQTLVGVPTQAATLPLASRKRMVADVAFNSDPYSGQYTVITPVGGATGYYAMGGTSAASPQWAGIAAVANSMLAAASSATSPVTLLGDPHATLYGNIANVTTNYASAFLDVTSGSDGSCAYCTAGNGYSTLTGLGTPNVSNLLPMLVAGNGPLLPPATLPAATTGKAYSNAWSTTDSTGSTLTYTATGLPSGLTLSTAGVVAWANPVTGSYSFSLTVANTAGKKSTETVSLAASTTPGAPVVPGGALTAKAGIAFSGTISATFASGTSPAYSVSGAPTGLAVNSTTGALSWPSPVAGSYAFSATVKTSGGSTTGGYTLAVSAAPAPSLSPVSYRAKAGAPFSATVPATDPSGFALTFTLSSAPSGLTLANASTGQVSWANPIAGSFTFSMTAKDTAGATATQTYALAISAPVPPTLPAAAFSGKVGTAFAGTIAGTGNNGWTLSYAMKGAPTGLTLTSTGMLAWAAPVAGQYSLAVTASDGAGTSTTTVFTLSIAAPVPPVFPTAALTGRVGTVLSATVKATDPQNSTLTYSVAGAVPTGLTVSSAGVVSWAKPVAGTYSLSITATDALAVHTATVFSLVVAAAQPPVVTALAVAGTVGTGVTAKVSAADANGYALTFGMTGAPAGMVLSNAGVLGWTTPVQGTYPVVVTATDTAGLMGHATYTFTIVKPHLPPVVIAAQFTAAVNVAFTGAVQATDPNGAALALSMTGAPAGLVLTNAGALTWPKPVKGTYTVQLTAKDSLGLSGTATITLTAK